MTHGSLFSGIGAAEIAAEMLGWENIFHCEINPFGRQILNYWFPNSDSYEDITKTDFSQYKGRIDVLTGGFPCQPFSYAGKRGGRQMTVISGMKCSELLNKSDQCGLLARMLMESPLWWNPLKLLKWDASPLYSTREMEFTDTNQSRPLPLNESAQILSQRDIQSNRCLFRLVLSVRHIEETASSSLPIMLQTPTAVMTCESPERMRARAERKGYQNGTKYGSLESQIMYDPRVAESLSVMVGSSLFPTPAARDWRGRTNPGVTKKGSGCKYGETLPDVIERIHSDHKKDGKPFRLSPLFTEEMMGFPLMWTALPFFLENGEPKQ